MGAININNGNLLTLYTEKDDIFLELENIINKFNNCYYYLESKLYGQDVLNFINYYLNLTVEQGYTKGVGITVDSALLDEGKKISFDCYDIKCQVYQATKEAEEIILNLYDNYNLLEGTPGWVSSWNDYQTGKKNIKKQFIKLRKIIKKTPCFSRVA